MEKIESENLGIEKFSSFVDEYEKLKKRLYEIDAEVVERGDEEEMLDWGRWGGGRIVKAEYLKEIEGAIENYKKGIDKDYNLGVLETYIKLVKEMMPKCEEYSKRN